MRGALPQGGRLARPRRGDENRVEDCCDIDCRGMGARRRGAETGTGIELSEPPHPLHRSLQSRRRGRHLHPHHRAKTLGGVWTDGRGGQPGRRQRRHRHRSTRRRNSPGSSATISPATPRSSRRRASRSSKKAALYCAAFFSQSPVTLYSNKRSGSGSPARSSGLRRPSGSMPKRSSTWISCRACCAECQVERSNTACIDCMP